jgi:predicted ATPase
MARLLDRDAQGCRLLTLTGPGGSGKTRVAVKLATSLQGQFEDGACFVALAPISDPKLVARTIAKTIGVRDASGSAAFDSLRNYLRDRRMLLVLDSFEQVLAAAVEIPQLLAACSRLQ